MVSINTLKDHQKKVGNYEDDTNTIMVIPPGNRKSVFFLIPTITLTTLILYIAAATILHNPTTFESKLTESQVTSIICNLATYPKSCFSSLQFLTTLDPQYFFQASLRVTYGELTNISSLPQQLITKVNDPPVRVALLDCQCSLADAVNRVNVSLYSTEKWIPDGKMLTRLKINDIIKWLTAALKDIQVCLDGLHENQPLLHDDMVARTRNAREYTSNSLAIAGQMEKIILQLHIPMY